MGKVREEGGRERREGGNGDRVEKGENTLAGY